jgi:succinate dehydrogenase / fumarate reductase cytochrome b subunit
MPQRPLSPHVFIYRFAYTMATSIFHRVAGMALSCALLLLVGLLLAIADGPDAYARYAAIAGSWPGRIVLGLALLAFCYHFANGIRHLLWDAGIGLERKVARRSAQLVVVVVVLATAALLYLFLQHGGGT